MESERARTVGELLARQEHAPALAQARAELAEQPTDPRLRVQLCDALLAAGHAEEAVGLLREVADALASGGFAARSIAVLKRIERIDPRPDLEDTLAARIEEKTRRSSALNPFRPLAALAEFGLEDAAEERMLGLASLEAAAPAPALPSAADAPPGEPFQEFFAEEPTPGAVAHTPLFPDFSRDELVAVMRGLQLLVFEPGDLIVGDGEVGDSMYLLTTGRVKAWVKGQAGRYLKVRELAEGDFFGEIALLSGQPRTATVTAATRCELLVLDRPTLDAIAATHPGVTEVLRRFYAERTRVRA